MQRTVGVYQRQCQVSVDAAIRRLKLTGRNQSIAAAHPAILNVGSRLSAARRISTLLPLSASPCKPRARKRSFDEFGLGKGVALDRSKGLAFVLTGEFALQRFVPQRLLWIAAKVVAEREMLGFLFLPCDTEMNVMGAGPATRLGEPGVHTVKFAEADKPVAEWRKSLFECLGRDERLN